MDRRYKICPGVELVTVCGKHMLVATRKARNKVNNINVINDTGAHLWRLLERKLSVNEIIEQVSLDYEETKEKSADFLPDKNQLILIYCRSGRRSKIAAETLVSLGYTNIKEFGGIIDWPYDIVK